jgi:aminopeptidase N
MKKQKEHMQKKCFAAALVVLTGCLIFAGDVFAAPTGNKDAPKMESEWIARKNWMMQYGTVVKPGSEAALRDLRGDGDAVARTMGEGKAALVLHVLRQLVGEAVFSRMPPTVAGHVGPGAWDAIKASMEKESRRDLGWFFTQWVDRKGLPDVRVENASVRRNGSRFELSMELVQKGEPYTLDLPVSTSFIGGGVGMDVVRIDGEKKTVSLLFDEEPASVAIDPGYDVPRRLAADELPPILAKVLIEDRPILVSAATATGLYENTEREWKQRGAEERRSDAIKDSDIKASSFIVLGSDNPFIQRLYGKVEAGNGALVLTATKNPWNSDKTVVIVHAGSAQSASETVRVIAESGICTTVSINAQGAAARTIGGTRKGIVIELRDAPPVIDVSAFTTLSRAIEGVAGRKVVYVGEYHDRFAHHNIQLQVIKALLRKDPRMAIGMEMFQRPFQKTLDDYINGSIDEREFLRRAEYFKRWTFDYNLYKPILDFARAERVPVVALNISREITDKVSKSGLDSLTPEERKSLPSQTDFSDTEYRDRLKQVFDQHRGSGERNFDSFYQAQILWDETMAQSIDEYLSKNSDRRMVVIAGLGHIAYGSGIPKRALRRNGQAYAVILSDVAVDPGIADYIVFPQSLDGLTAPKLMVALKEAGGRVSITDLPEGSVSKAAGIKKGDTFISIDDAVVKSADDVKIALFYKKKDEVVKVRVVRQRFLLGDTELEFSVKLP